MTAIRDAFRRGAERVGIKPEPKVVATRACKMRPGDFPIPRIKDERARTIDEALVVFGKR